MKDGKEGDGVNKKISVVVPMYFEEEMVNEFYNRTKAAMESIEGYDYELIFVNDGSTDQTLPLLKAIANEDNKVKVISFSRNFGHSMAVTAGIDYATGDATVLIDADLQDPPELIAEFVKQWEQGFDVIYGQRAKRKGETFFKKASANLFYKTLDSLTEMPIPQNTGDFRLMDKKVVDQLKRMGESSRFIRGMVSWVGFKQTAVLYTRDERYAGETKYSLSKMIAFAINGITSLSNKPLRVVIKLGFLTIFIDVLLFLYIIYSVINGDTIDGWASTMVVNVFFYAVIMIVLGIIGEYIGKIYEEVKLRPKYIVDEEINIESDEIKSK